MNMLCEYDRVRTKVEKEGFPAGTTGVVVSLYGEGAAYEVELWDEHNYPVDVVMFLEDELTVVPKQEYVDKG